MKLTKAALSGIVTAIVLLVLVVLLLKFPNRPSPNDLPVWVILLIVFVAVFTVSYARAKYEQKRQKRGKQ